MDLNLSNYSDTIYEMGIQFGTKIVACAAVLVIGFWLVGSMMKVIKKGFDKRGIDESLNPFLLGIISSLLKVLIVISALGVLGIEMTSFIAILGAAGLAVGMALSGTLSNFAGGVMILIFQPFKVGDYIEAQGYSGSVKEIGVFNTIMNTPDNKTIVIPNGGLSSGSMVNYSTELTRRIDWTVGIGYGDDYDKAKAVLDKFIAEDARILKDPTHFIALHALAESSVNITVRAWVNAPDYWGVYFQMIEKIYKNFGIEGLNIPFPQIDVHVHNS